MAASYASDLFSILTTTVMCPQFDRFAIGRKVSTSMTRRRGETGGRIQDPREGEPIAAHFFLALIHDPSNIRRHILALARVVLYISYACAVLCS